MVEGDEPKLARARASVSAASGLTAATRMVRPSAVCGPGMKDQAQLASAMAMIEIQLRPAKTTCAEPGLLGMPLMPLGDVAERDEHLGEHERCAQRDKAEIETLHAQRGRREQQAHRDREAATH